MYMYNYGSHRVSCIFAFSFQLIHGVLVAL